MNTTPALHAAAAGALAAMLPSTAPLDTARWPLNEGELPVSGSATVVTDYVGPVSAELALTLSAAAEAAVRQAGGASVVALADVVRPALEAAGDVLGPGVLGEGVERDATALFLDPETVVYRLALPGSTDAFAWLAIKISTMSAATPVPRVSAAQLGRIHDVEMALSVVIGKTRMSVGNVLGLEPGDVVDLDRSASAPADILLNGRLIAHGEVVVVDQDYAVRVTRILDTAETVG